VEQAHRPVLLGETLELLSVRPGGFYVDGTTGLGGHAFEILSRSAPDGRLLGVDRDAETLERARERLAPFAGRARLVHADYRSLPDLLAGDSPDGILLDLGLSSLQLDSPERGFSFRREGPLDMRMDRSGGPTAEEVVNLMPEDELADTLYGLGEERRSRRIAGAIAAARRRGRIRTTTELREIVARAVGGRGRGRIDPATRTFQALRIFVNRELEGLGDTLRQLARRLAPGGRLAVISLHSPEDREVKRAFRELGAAGFRVLTRRPVRPGPEERQVNPRSRSARLRGLERSAA
jgi:16S rRNA (cytosine1402-N4)-methyltransferase